MTTQPTQTPAPPPEPIEKPVLKRRSRAIQPVLRFTPAAWAKLQFFCHYGKTEIGGFGVAPADDLLLVAEFETVKQTVSAVSVAFDDQDVAEYFDDQVIAGRRPEQCGRLWLHTHPGGCPNPSGTDEETFARVFGGCEWAVMFILARGGDTYARLQFNVGPGGALLIPVEIDYRQPFEGSAHAAWLAEYERNIRFRRDLPASKPKEDWPGASEPFGAMDALEQDLFQGYPPEAWEYEHEEVWP